MVIPMVITIFTISLMVTMEGQYPTTLETRKINRTVTTNISTYGMRTVTTIQLIDKIDNQKTDTRTMRIDNRTICIDFKTSDVDTSTMTTRIFAKHHMEFTAKNILTNLLIYTITRGQITLIIPRSK